MQLNELQKELNVDSLKECASKSKKISEKIEFLYNFQCISLEEIDDETFNTIADHDLVIETWKLWINKHQQLQHYFESFHKFEKKR